MTLTAKSEHNKKALDVAAAGSYKDMLSASANFTGHMESQSSFRDLSMNVFVNGGDVPSVVSTIPDVKTEILDALDTGGKCTKENAVASQVLVRDWLSLQTIAKLAQQNPKIYTALRPKVSITPDILSRINNIVMKTKTLVQLANKCHENVFSCMTKQWNEPVAMREVYYTNALLNLTVFQNDVQQIIKATVADHEAVLHFEQRLEAIYLKWLRPAEALTSFVFTFTIRVLNKYDHWADPPPKGTRGLIATFTIDPNHEDTSKDIPWTKTPQIDNGHHGTHHYQGYFYASFKADVLTVCQYWNKHKRWTPNVLFHPGGDSGAKVYYDNSVATVYTFTVTYNYADNMFLPDNTVPTYTSNIVFKTNIPERPTSYTPTFGYYSATGESPNPDAGNTVTAEAVGKDDEHEIDDDDDDDDGKPRFQFSSHMPYCSDEITTNCFRR